MPSIRVQRSDDPGEPWYFVIVGDNGETLAVSENYHRRVDALATAELIGGTAIPVTVEKNGDESDTD